MHLKSAIAVAVISFGFLAFVKALPMDNFYDEFEDTAGLSKRGVKQITGHAPASLSELREACKRYTGSRFQESGQYTTNKDAACAAKSGSCDGQLKARLVAPTNYKVDGAQEYYVFCCYYAYQPSSYGRCDF